MNAAKKIILLLWWLVVASFTTASALTPGAAETRVGQKSFAPLESRQAEPLQPLDLRQANASCGYELAPESLLAAEGTQVYRVWGGKSGPWGESWTTVNPNTVPNFRSAAGLPDVNTGRFVSEGVLQSTEGVTARGALVIKPGQQGNLPELVIKNAEQKIKLQRVSGANPEF